MLAPVGICLKQVRKAWCWLRDEPVCCTRTREAGRWYSILFVALLCSGVGMSRSFCYYALHSKRRAYCCKVLADTLKPLSVKRYVRMPYEITQ